jgi:hypothetical protein
LYVPVLINWHILLYNSTLRVNYPQNIGVTTQPSVIVNHVNSQGATGQQTSNQNIGAPSQGGINTTNTTGPAVAGNLPAKTVIINSQGGIIQQNVPINQNRNIQGGYGQPQRSRWTDN